MGYSNFIRPTAKDAKDTKETKTEELKVFVLDCLQAALSEELSISN
jgi:hypothetical protein